MIIALMKMTILMEGQQMRIMIVMEIDLMNILVTIIIIIIILIILCMCIVGGFCKVLRHDSIAMFRERRKNEPIQS